MKLSFHRDPVDIEQVCADLCAYGAVFVDTTRVNSKRIAELVEENGVEVIPLGVEESGSNADFHYFMLHSDSQIDNYKVGVTEKQVLKAIQAWRKAGSNFPHVEPV